jgi:transposase
MRGTDTFTESPFTLNRLEDFVPADHPLRAIRQMVNEALGKMDALFAAMYEAPSKGGRPSVAPEKLLRAMLLQVFYSIRSERQLMEQVQYNLLYRWVSSAWPWRMRCGCPRCSRKTASACSRMTP